MIWTFTKNSHIASSLRVVRWWLRTSAFEKFLISLGIAFLSVLHSFWVMFSQPDGYPDFYLNLP